MESDSLTVPSPASSTAIPLPVALRVIAIYIGYSIAMHIWGLQGPTLLIGPFSLGKAVAVSYKLFSLVVLAFCLYGILKRKNWGWHLNLTWFGYGILFSIINFTFSLIYKSELPDAYQKYAGQQVPDEFTALLVALFALVFTLIVNSIVCWHVYWRREFFRD